MSTEIVIEDVDVQTYAETEGKNVSLAIAIISNDLQRDYDMPHLKLLLQEDHIKDKDPTEIARLLRQNARYSDVKPEKKKHVPSPKLEAPTQVDTSVYTAAYAMLKDSPIPGNAKATMAELLVAMMEVGKFEKTADMASACTVLIQVLALTKMPFGALDLVKAQSITPDAGKTILASMLNTTKIYVSTPALVAKLLEYQFKYEAVVDNDLKDNEETVPSFVLSEDGKQRSLAVLINEQIADTNPAQTKFTITLDDVALTCDMTGMVEGDIPKFMTSWNMLLNGQEMIYVEIDSVIKHKFDTLLAAYDLVYSNEKWTASKHVAFSSTHYVDIKDEKIKKMVNEQWDVASKLMKVVAENMTKNHKYNKHYVEQYNIAIIEFKRALEAKVEEPLTEFYGWLGIKLNGDALVSATKARNNYSMAYKQQPVAEAFAEAKKVRDARRKYRNIGPREFLTKNLFDAMLALAVSPMCTARKFIDIMAKNPDLYQMDADVYGTAHMHFFNALVNNPYYTVPNGKRQFFDISQGYCSTYMGYKVEMEDFYAMQVGRGKDRGLVDDVVGTCSKESKVKYQVYDDKRVDEIEVTFKKNCMTHKSRIIHVAEYKHFASKMMVDKMSQTASELVTASWLLPYAQYETVIFDVPGKMQSGEFFIYGRNRLDNITKGRFEALKKQWLTFIKRKSIVMTLTNHLMDSATKAKDPVRIKQSIFASALIRSIVPEGVSTAKYGIVVRNALSVNPRNVLPVAPGFMAYKGYCPLGRIYQAKTEAEAEADTVAYEEEI